MWLLNRVGFKMDFDYVYEEEWRLAGLMPEMVDNSRKLIRSVLSEEFIDKETKRSHKMGQDILTRDYLGHPILTQLKSPFLGQVCSLVHLAEALTSFKNEASISEYISRLKQIELYKAARFELEFAYFLKKMGYEVLPSRQTKYGEIDIYAPQMDTLTDIYFECKSYNPKKNTEEGRRNICGYFMKKLNTLPKGYVICFRSYVLITEDNIKHIKNKINNLFNKAEELYVAGRTHHDLFFGELDIRYFDVISDDVVEAIRSEYNEFTARTFVHKDKVNLLWKDDVTENDKKEAMYRENAFAFDLPLPDKSNSKKTDYLLKAKTDISDKIKQHRTLLNDEKYLCIVLEDIPAEAFMKLKQEAERGLYEKYKNLSIIFVKKQPSVREVSFEIKPLKVFQGMEFI